MRGLAPAFLFAAVAACGGPGAPPPASFSKQQALLPEHLTGLPRILLDLHNRERAAVGAPPLAWDASLAAAAAGYGPILARGTGLVHAAPSTRRGQGENLWMGTRDRYALETMFDSWAREKSMLREGIFPAVSRTGRWEEVAHYTQIVWRGTSRVGCAVHRAADWDYLICRYSPPGNVRGQRVP